MSEGAIRQLESGNVTSPSLLLGIRLADALHVDPRHLAHGDGPSVTERFAALSGDSLRSKPSGSGAPGNSALASPRGDYAAGLSLRLGPRFVRCLASSFACSASTSALGTRAIFATSASKGLRDLAASDLSTVSTLADTEQLCQQTDEGNHNWGADQGYQDRRVDAKTVRMKSVGNHKGNDDNVVDDRALNYER